MTPGFQRFGRVSRTPGTGVAVILFLVAVSLAGPAAHAQGPRNTVGRIQGIDVSVEGGTAANAGDSNVPPSIFVANGSVVTVHSGKAQFTLSAGGTIDICGPAKLTVLQADNFITLALNLGRMRVQLPASTVLRIFTPTIIATPIEIGGETRDITIGLDLSDSLCVLAASGALRLEHQFTGEGLIVPQSGEFFLAGGKLEPIAGAPGTCQCQALEVRIAPPRPPIPVRTETASAALPVPPAGVHPTIASNAATAPALVAPEPAVPEAAPPASPVFSLPEPTPEVEYSVLAHGNRAHPTPNATASGANGGAGNATKARGAPPPQPMTPGSLPEYKVLMPPLTFSASSPTPPPDPTAEEVLLIRYARVDPEWEFRGHVDTPSLDTRKQQASNRAPQSANKPERRKEGFWSRLKRVFTG
jgi:hypothetical protein